MTAFVEPPNASTTVIAFSKCSRVSRNGSRDTMRRPAATAIRGCAESAAGIDAAPGSDTPSASAADVIVDAVPIVMQCPGDDAIRVSISSHSSCESRPARSLAQYFQTSEPEPSTPPRYDARSIGPAGTYTNGSPRDTAPMISAGVVLSHPPSSTAPSNG